MTHQSGHVILSKVKAFAANNKAAIAACVASFVLGALFF